MNKSIMFILLELFTIRHYRNYCLSDIRTVRDFIIKHIEEFDDVLHFKLKTYSDAVKLSHTEYLLVRYFIEYINSIDKIVKV